MNNMYDQNNMYSPKMTKKEYFKSDLCSGKARGCMIANSVCFAILAVVCGFLLVGTIGIVGILSNIDFSQGIEAIFSSIEVASGEKLDVDPEVFMSLQDVIPVNELIKWSFYIAIGYIALMMVLIIVFSAVAITKKAYGYAIAALAITLLSGLGALGIGLSIAILVLTIILSNEYKRYSQDANNGMNYNGYNNGGDFNNPNSFNNPNNNEPDFS